MTDVPLRDHVERLLLEHNRYHESEKEASQRALEEALTEVQRRLGELNQLRMEVTTDRSQFVQRVAFEAKLDASDKEVRLLRNEIGALSEAMARLAGRQAAYAVMLAIALVVVPLILQLVLKQNP